MKRIIICSLLFVSIASVMASAQGTKSKAVYVNPVDGRFPVMAYHSLTDSMLSRERFNEMAEAGFNISLSNYSSIDIVQKAVDSARGTGVKIMVHCPELKTDVEGTVKRFNDNDGVAGYFLRDEPATDLFPELARWARKVGRYNTSNKLVYINMLPMFAKTYEMKCDNYQKYVDKYLSEVAPYLGFLSFDIYPVKTDGIRPEFYNNLDIIYKAAQENNMPFWAFALSSEHQLSSHNAPYPHPDRASLRFQIFSDLAYGAQGIEYFTYVQPKRPSGSKNMYCIYEGFAAPILVDGKRTDVFDNIAELNREVQDLAWVFLGAKVEKIIHLGEYYPRPYQPDTDFPPMIPSVVSGNGGKDLFLVSHLVNGDRHFLMIVNRDLYEPRKVTVERKPGVMRVMPDGTLLDASLYGEELQVEPGDMLLFEWEE